MENIDYIAQDSVEFTLSFYELVYEKIKNLEEFERQDEKSYCFQKTSVSSTGINCHNPRKN